jgi:hypothetical protein
MGEVIEKWLKPDYLPMLGAVAALLKYIVIPAVKAVWVTACDGSTSIKIACVSGPLVALLYKLLTPLPWSAAAIVMTLVTGVLAGFTAIGYNTTIAAAKGKDVSIS